MAVLGLRFCARAFSSCGRRGPLFITVSFLFMANILLYICVLAPSLAGLGIAQQFEIGRAHV